jgi:CRISPR-associated protein Csm4
MPELIPYHLAFQGGLHTGTHGLNLEEAGSHLPADTLFSALLSVWRRSGEDVDALAAPFAAAPPDPPFLLSSAFPFAGAVRFYPMPVDLARLFRAETLACRGKAVKGIRYLSEVLFRKALRGEKLDDDLFLEDERAEPLSGVALQGGALWLSAGEVEELPKDLRRPTGKLRSLHHLRVWEAKRVPRVTVDRISSASTVYQAGRLSFAEDCGLWFGLSWLREGDRTLRAAFERALAVLQDDGLGGERAAGYGAFTYRRAGVLRLPEPAAGRPAWLLSRYHPRPEELPAALQAPGAAYSLVAVGGWLSSPDGAAQRRKRLYLLAEGSLVCPPAYPAGDLTDLCPEYESGRGLGHPVYRYGLALAAGLPAGEGAHG